MSGKPQQKKRPAGEAAGQPQKKANKGEQKQDEKKQAKPAQKKGGAPQQKGDVKQQGKPKQQQQQQPKKQAKKAEPQVPAAAPEEEDLTSEVPISDKDMEAINTIESDLQKINKKIASEVRAIELKHEAAREPLLVKRDKILNSIPDFWMKVFLGCPHLESMLTPADLEIANHLETVKVKNLPANADGSDGGFTISMTFKPNPILDSKLVEKKFEIKPAADEEEDAEVTVTSSDIKFKDAKFVEENANSFFVGWLANPDQETDETLGQLFREEIYPNSFSFFLSTYDDDEDDMDGLGAFGDDEDGEGEGAAGAEGDDN